MLLVKDYPKAEPGRSPVRSISAKPDPEVDDLISGQAVPTPKSRARRKAQDTLAAAQAPVRAAPVAEAKPRLRPKLHQNLHLRLPQLPQAPNVAPISAKLREQDAEQLHSTKHKPVDPRSSRPPAARPTVRA